MINDVPAQDIEAHKRALMENIISQELTEKFNTILKKREKEMGIPLEVYVSRNLEKNLQYANYLLPIHLPLDEEDTREASMFLRMFITSGVLFQPRSKAMDFKVTGRTYVTSLVQRGSLNPAQSVLDIREMLEGMRDLKYTEGHRFEDILKASKLFDNLCDSGLEREFWGYALKETQLIDSRILERTIAQENTRNKLEGIVEANKENIPELEDSIKNIRKCWSDNNLTTKSIEYIIKSIDKQIVISKIPFRDNFKSESEVEHGGVSHIYKLDIEKGCNITINAECLNGGDVDLYLYKTHLEPSGKRWHNLKQRLGRKETMITSIETGEYKLKVYSAEGKFKYRLSISAT